jgi:amidase
MAHDDPAPAQPPEAATTPDHEVVTTATDVGASDPGLAYRSAAELGRMLETGAISASELLDATVTRVEDRNDEINVVVTLDLDGATRLASKIDDLRGAGDPAGRLGPLAGVPITIKDSLMVAGVRTTSGAPELSDFVPDRDADCVAALKRAGVVVYGKTNLPLYAGDVQTFNDVFGTSNNPWDVSRTVGGSSGGSAGALAAGFTALEIGSDIAGSIRNPAAMCGVVGHKPSYGIVSGRGQIPGPPGTYTEADIAVIGPMARTVDDCVTALELMIGPNDWYSPAWSLRLPPARCLEPHGLRVAVWADDAYCPIDPEIRSAILDVARRLEQAGAEVDTEARPAGFDFAKADTTFLQLLGGALSGGWKPDELESMAEDLKAGRSVPGGLGVEGATMRHRAWLSANERRLQMRARWREFFQHWDVVLAPIAPTVAIPHDHSHPMSARTIEVAGEVRPYGSLMQWMGLFGLVYLPATAVPIGLHSSGLPMALQVVGPFLEDHTALAVAAMVESLTGGFRRPPGW